MLESKLEGRGRLKVMFKVRRVKPAAEDGWFGDEDGQEWSPYMAGARLLSPQLGLFVVFFGLRVVLLDWCIRAQLPPAMYNEGPGP